MFKTFNKILNKIYPETKNGYLFWSVIWVILLVKNLYLVSNNELSGWWLVIDIPVAFFFFYNYLYYRAKDKKENENPSE